MNVFDAAFDRFRTILEFNSAVLFRIIDHDLVVIAYQGTDCRAESPPGRFALTEIGDPAGLFAERAPISLDDGQADTRQVQVLRKLLANRAVAAEKGCRWLAIPLFVQDRLVGMIALGHQKPAGHTAKVAARVQALADELAMNLENAMLYAQAARRADEYQTLLAVQRAITSRLDLDDVLQMIADGARRLTNSHHASVMLLEGDVLVVSVISGKCGPGLEVGYRLPFGNSMTGQAIREGRPLYALDALHDSRTNYDISILGETDSMMSVPLLSEDRPLGAIVVTNKIDADYGPDDQDILMALAPAAVIGLENARLYAQAEEFARLQERQSIAQSLHDTLAQRLFSICLQVQQVLNESTLDPAVRQDLQDIMHLAERGGHELRTAIFALRNRHLTKGHGLAKLLQELIAGFQVESSIEATLFAPSPFPSLSLPVNEMIYRITREALSNVRKHSRATAVIVSLRCVEGGIELTIQDNGVGLAPAAAGEANSLHFGVLSMRESVARAGGQFLLTNNDDQGTMVKVRLPINEGVA